jgi:hypothetical protein
VTAGRPSRLKRALLEGTATAMVPPTSVLLPTTEWTPACAEVATQLGPADELLVVCDDADPIAGHEGEFPERVRLVRAGEPAGCLGKAKAIAAGMGRARGDRIVWTDDDYFHHPPDWLAGLHADYETHGPVSELPFSVGRDPLSILLEPLYVLAGTLGVYAGRKAWGGAVLFERADFDWRLFLADLRWTVSDDGLLSEYLDVRPRCRTRTVPIGGTIRGSIERHARFVLIAWYHDPWVALSSTLLISLFALASVLSPVFGFVAATGFLPAVYAAFGVRRWTVLLAYPATGI